MIKIETVFPFASQMSVHNKLNHLNIKDKPMDCNKNKNKIEKEENKIWIPLQKKHRNMKILQW